MDGLNTRWSPRQEALGASLPQVPGAPAIDARGEP